MSVDPSQLSTKEKLAYAKQGVLISAQGFDTIISNFLNYFKNCGFAEGDSRHYNLSMILQTLIYTKFQREIFIEEIDSDNKKIEKYLRGVGERNLYGFLEQFDVYNRATFATLFNFQFEMIFKGILEEMNVEPESDDYYFTVKSLVDEIYSDEEEKTKKRRILMTMAQIRNSLHLSGKHTSKHEFEIELEGIQFKFETGKQINQTSWGHLFIISNAMLSILIEILSSKKVKDIPFINKK